MRIELEQYAVWLPGRGVALNELSGSLEGLTLVVGRNATGATTLLNALSQTFAPGASERGTMRSMRADGRAAVIVRAPRAWELPQLPFDLLAGSASARSLLEQCGIHGSAEAFQSVEARTLMGLAWALGREDADVVVIDQLLAHVHAWQRRPLAEAVRAAAARGVLVVWAENLWHEVLALADHVVELSDQGATVERAATWVPRTVALPPHAAVARALGLPRDRWFDVSAVGELDAVRRAVARPRGSSRLSPGAADAGTVAVGDAVQVPGARSGLGIDLELFPHENVAMLAQRDLDSEEAVQTAARVVAARATSARGPRTPRSTPVLPGSITVGRLLRHWARSQGTDPDAVLAVLDGLAELDLQRKVAQHSRGEQALLLSALLLTGASATALVMPEEHLDSEARRRFAALLATRHGVVFTARDEEFAARAADRWVLLGTSAGQEELEGPPVALAGALQVPPLLVRAGARAIRAVDVIGDVTGEMR